MKKEGFIWKDYHHQIYQVYHGLIAVTLVPFALLFLQWNSEIDNVQANPKSWIFIITLQLLWVIGYLSWYVWKGSKVQYDSEEGMDVQEKLKEFRKKNVSKYLLLTIIGMIASFAMWIQPSFIFVIAYLSTLIQFSFLRPSEDKIVRDMRLTKSDREWLHKQA
ncbi:hypothetical protein [Ekhidna sp.]|uniref:hypothetical protein n=1 Tax=Ekhidna sp. TaxID=2608089 RepID=UPI003B514675